MKKENILKKLGFKKNRIYETIVTTSNGKEKNAAPIGIWTKNFSNIEMEIYKNSQSYKNILSTNELVVNFVDKPEIFYNAIYSKNKIKYKKAKKIKVPVLMKANGWLELKLDKKVDNGKKIKVCAEIVAYTFKEKKVTLMNRAKALVLESLIKSTKVPLKKNEIRENLRVIKKVAPNSEYEKIVAKLLKR